MFESQMSVSNRQLWMTKLGIDLQPIAGPIIDNEQSGAMQSHGAAGISGEFYFTPPSPIFLPDVDGNARRLIWLPKPLPSLSTVCIASSRMPQQLANYPTWLAALRTILCRLDPTRDAILTAEQTTTHKLCQRGAELFRLPLFVVSRIPKIATPRWFAKQAALPVPPNAWRIFVAVDSNLLPNDVVTDGADSIDWLLIGMAQRVQLLSVRKEGNIERAVRRRIHSFGADAITWLLRDDRLTEPALRKTLVVEGCIDWVLQADPADSSSAPTSTSSAPSLELLPKDLDDFLFHWTRGSRMRTRGKTQHPLCDRLLFRTASDPSGATATLLEILGSQTILGSNALSRDKMHVVSLTENRIEQWRQHRQFRSHLGRWDFEPFGIALRRILVEHLNGRPVIYGNELIWQKLDPSLRPYFQIAESTRGKKQIDWRLEREWRTIGDIDLRKFGPNDAFVFVADAASAKLLSPFSRWPVIVLPH
jgi:hypothetical protein